MPEEMEDILRSEHILSLATCLDQQPYLCSVFYIYLRTASGPGIFFASDESTRHVQEFSKNSQVAGNVFFNTEEPGKIVGIQMTGAIRTNGDWGDVRAKYIQRFPYARKQEPFRLWMLEIHYAKMTDNRVHFGYKSKWYK